MSSGQLTVNGYRLITQTAKGSFIQCFKAHHVKYGYVALIISSKYQELCRRMNFYESNSELSGICKLYELQKIKYEDNALELLCDKYPHVFTPNSYLLSGQFYDTDFEEYNQMLCPSQKLDQFYKVLKIVNELHQNGIAHMDLKPNNIRYFEDEPVLIDFGEVIQMANKIVKSVQNRSAYAPVHDVYNCEVKPTAFDVYCLGSMLHEILLQKLPEKWFQQYNKQYDNLIKHCGLEWADLITRMMNKNQFERITIQQCLNHPAFKMDHTNQQASFYTLIKFKLKLDSPIKHHTDDSVITVLNTENEIDNRRCSVEQRPTISDDSKLQNNQLKKLSKWIDYHQSNKQLDNSTEEFQSNLLFSLKPNSKQNRVINISSVYEDTQFCTLVKFSLDNNDSFIKVEEAELSVFNENILDMW
ncbi:Kinase [Hexamita inflata]|uniref:Kinase n=1 Tax=Hexamita inflata TaxID=28002 RepID=A0AA86Q2C5_9EUKA|nr:Kinase [Hexamita inflata]